MSDLKHLLNATKKMLEELQTLRPAQSPGPLSVSLTISEESSGGGHRQQHQHSDSNSEHCTDGNAALDTTAAVASSKCNSYSNSNKNIPSWVMTTPQEVERFIVEQQYSKAVTLVVRSLAYLDRVSGVGGYCERLSETRDAIQRNRLLLAQTLRDSLTTVTLRCTKCLVFYCVVCSGLPCPCFIFPTCLSPILMTLITTIFFSVVQQCAVWIDRADQTPQATHLTRTLRARGARLRNGQERRDPEGAALRGGEWGSGGE